MREREAFFRNACHQKDREYQALMDEQLNGFDKLEKLKTELNQARDEVKARDRYLDNLQKQLEEKEQARANLQKELEEKENAIATLQAQSQQQLQLTLPLITDSLDPAVTSHQPSVTSQESEVISQQSEEQRDTKNILKTSELADYINQKFTPQKPISKQNITDAARGASKRMPQLEADYSFKFLGKIRGEYRFKILS